MKIGKEFWNVMKESLEYYLKEFVDPDNKKSYCDEYACHARKLLDTCEKTYDTPLIVIDDGEIHYLNQILQWIKEPEEQFMRTKEFKELVAKVEKANATDEC